jgi:hypothetical protein
LTILAAGALALLLGLATGGRALAQPVGLVEIGGQVYTKVAIDDLIDQFGCSRRAAEECRERRGFAGTRVVTAGYFRHDWTVERVGGRNVSLLTSADVLSSAYEDWVGEGAHALPVAVEALPDLFSRASEFDCTERGGRYCEIVVYGTVTETVTPGAGALVLEPAGYRITRARSRAGIWWSGVADLTKVLLVISRIVNGVII